MNAFNMTKGNCLLLQFLMCFFVALVFILSEVAEIQINVPP